jgi:hypothetical protein
VAVLHHFRTEYSVSALISIAEMEILRGIHFGMEDMVQKADRLPHNLNPLVRFDILGQRCLLRNNEYRGTVDEMVVSRKSSLWCTDEQGIGINKGGILPRAKKWYPPAKS